MNRPDYLQRLEVELKDLSPEEKNLLLEEISTHLLEGQDDPHLGPDEKERADQLITEMGSPEDLGRRLKNLYHPKRWLEYCLIVLPEILLLPILSGIMSLLFPVRGIEPSASDFSVYMGIRASILLQICLVFIGLMFYQRQRRATGLLFWLSSLWLSIFSLCFREKRWALTSDYNQSTGGMVESIFWIILLIGLLMALLSILWQTKDLLFFALVSIPFLGTVGNLATSQLILSGGFPDGYALPNWRIGWFFGPNQVAFLLWPAVFLFQKQWLLRWLALLFYAASWTLLNLVASARYPSLMVVWALPFLFVSFCWLFDTINNRHPSRIT